MEVLGANGYTRMGSPAAILAGRVERMHRASLILTFGGGTNEVQRDIIAGAGLQAAGQRTLTFARRQSIHTRRQTMDFALTEAQLELAALTRTILTDQGDPLQRLRAVEEAGGALSPTVQLWRSLADAEVAGRRAA